MTKQHIEFVLSGYGVPFTDALADKLLEMFDEEAASYQHTINELNKALSENKGEWIAIDDVMSVFDDFMCGDVDEDGMATFLEMLKDKAESEVKPNE